MCCTHPALAQTKTKAQIDTIRCDINCIEGFVSQKSTSGKTKIFAVYNNKQQDISDLIPVSDATFTYLQQCKKYKMRPSLGIRLRNGQISSIIKVKPKYIVK